MSGVITNEIIARATFHALLFSINGFTQKRRRYHLHKGGDKITPTDELKERAKCVECGRYEYCNRIPVNRIVVDAIRKDGKCPDFTA